MQTEAVKDWESEPVVHSVALPETDGDGEEDAERQEDAHPLIVGEAVSDDEEVPEVDVVVQTEAVTDWESEPVVHSVVLPVTDGDGEEDAERQEDAEPHMVGDELIDDVWLPEYVAVRQAVDEPDWESEPVVHTVMLPDTDGDGEDDAERHADAQPLVVDEALGDDFWLPEFVAVPQTEEEPDWESELVVQTVMLPVADGDGEDDAERHADAQPLVVGDALSDDVWLPEYVAVPQAVEEPVWESEPVVHSVALPEKEGDGEEDEERHADAHPLTVCDSLAESVTDGVRLADAHADVEADGERVAVPQSVALAVPDWEGVDVAERHADAHPLGVGETLGENDVEAEKDEETHAVAVADCDKLPVLL